MSVISRLVIILSVLFSSFQSQAQHTATGKIIDALTKEPIQGATIHCIDNNCFCGCTTNASGEFSMKCRDCSKLNVSSVGYQSMQILTSAQVVYLLPATNTMNEVVVSATRGDAVKRSNAPIAISKIDTRLLQDTRAITVDQVLNKVSGVNMVNLGNEQHQMSIRQPMTTKSLFLYLEDGIPVRTTGLFNHNAVLEMNMAALKSIEVIKGPSSSLYGSEAIGGVVNFITIAPTAIPVLKVSLQGNTIGYKRAELQSSLSTGKWGFAISGYYADKRNSFMEYSDFHKATFTARADYNFNNKTNLSNSLTYLDYYSDMPSGVDSTMFATRRFMNPQTFTYRTVNALRYRSTLTQSWNDHSKTTLNLVYRENAIGQNPNYRIKDDYKKVNGVYKGNKSLAHGEINESSFHSYAFIAQHKQSFDWKKAVALCGISMDLSPSTYNAAYIRIQKDTVTRKYTGYQATDSLLTNYATRINNYAAFTNFEFSPVEKLRVVASLRFDLFHYGFNNSLAPSAFSGSRDTANNFKRFSPKIGFTYNLSAKTGIYGNYSQGFVPPQVTEMYTGVKVPTLSPSIFYNYEVGGWGEIIKNKLSADLSIYLLEGTNEVISVKLDDGSSENQNAGKTQHRGVEFGLNANPFKDLTLKISGAYSQHQFVDFVEKGNNYNGNEMNNAPRWMHNAEIWYKPSFISGLRLGAEWQRIGNYFMDARNTEKYAGYNVINLRAGYKLKNLDLWVNVMNTTGNYYSYISTKTASGYSYTLAEPRNFIVGVSYDLANLFKSKK
jgi:outer membrane receptor protein involved in Fe transport